MQFGDTLVHLTSRPQAATVMPKTIEITNLGTINDKSSKPYRVDFNGSTYLLLSYSAPTEEAAIKGGRSRFSVIIPYIEVTLGERFVRQQLLEECIDVSRRAPVWVFDAELDPRQFPLEELKDERLDLALEKWESLASRPPEGRNRVELALRWYHKGLLEELPDDKFLFYWVALEVLTMPGKTNTERTADEIKAKLLPNLERAKIEEKLKLGALFGHRSDIIHNGISIMANKHDARITLIKEIVGELLRAEIGVPPLGLLAKYAALA